MVLDVILVVLVNGEHSNPGTYIRWSLRNRCTRKEQSLLFNLFKAFDPVESTHKSDFFKKLIFLYAHHVLGYHII